jgi:predicted  nucleic acid-binding Zn-ribbon protein
MNLVLAPQQEGARKRGDGMPKQRVHPLVERMKRVEEALEHKMDKTDGEGLEERVSDLESNHEELESKLEDVDFKLDDVEFNLEEVSEKVEDHEGQLADAESRIDDLESEDR